MYRSIIVLVLFVIGMVYEIREIMAFERGQKQDKDEEFVKLFRKCHWTYFLIFAAAATDRVIALVEGLN